MMMIIMVVAVMVIYLRKDGDTLANSDPHKFHSDLPESEMADGWFVHLTVYSQKNNALQNILQLGLRGNAVD
jgi:hypothetical protein